MSKTRFDPLQAMMRRRQAEPGAAPASDYDRLRDEFRQLQKMYDEQQRQLSALRESGTLACPVTGLANRRALLAELERSLATARRYGRRHALIVLALHDFVPLTRQVGEEAAESVLRHIARIVRQNIRPTDIAAHPATGQFAVLLNELRSAENATTRAGELRGLIESTPCMLPGRSLHVMVGSGTCVFGQDDAADDILDKARLALLAEVAEATT